MRERIVQAKKAASYVSIPTLKQPTRGFGLDSLNASPSAATQAQPINKPITHDISRISLRPQAKLTIGQPGDSYEQEADSVAQQVMQRMAQPGNRQSIQRQEVPEEEEELQMKPLDISTLQRQEMPEEEEELQMKPLDISTLQRQEAPEEDEELQMKPLDISTLQRQEAPEEEEELQMKPLDISTLQRQEAPEEDEELQMSPMVQRKGQGGMAATPDLETSINQARGGGQPLGDNIRKPMEQAFGADFGGVKVHTDSRSDQLNQSIQARAFTTGQDVFFRQGEYNPGSRGGQELLAHELTHVVQQNGGMVQRSPLSYKVTDSKTVEDVIQRYDMTYGGLTNDCGTDMHVLIEGNTDPDLLKGSKPSVLPSWWPGSGSTERDYFQKYVVQGHLLNQDLGGPGDTMENLTPITKSTNTTHFKQIEDDVKKEVSQGNWVEYRVQADYTTHPSIFDVGVGVPASVAPYLAYFAGQIGADYTVYDPISGKKKGGLPGVKLIKNEGKHLKGTF